jgi:alkanesulfonate monooxygenase SsuD/methylene tetrahydromethanopterin reductase-like flavin-dependent oxidoreductase (luciferase family)
MRYAISIPNIGDAFGDPHFAADLAVEAEAAGWDGFFVWDHIGADWDWVVSDPWVTLAAIAVRTTTLVIGTGVTPLPRRRPWKLARETVTLDRLARGRVRLGVGIGTDAEHEYSCFDEGGDDALHGAMLDEGLAVLTGLWSGKPFSYHGEHYHVTNAVFLPTPVQQPRIPIWVAGLWPNKKPFRRAAQWDGIWPIGRDGPMTPADIRDMLAYTQQHRTGERAFDVVFGGETSGTDRAGDAAHVAAYSDASVTWWVEGLSNGRGSIEDQRKRVQQGPPKP